METTPHTSPTNGRAEWASGMEETPSVDLMLLHLGGTRVLGLLVTMDDRQGFAALERFNPTVAIPVHYNDYTVFKSPLDDFAQRVAQAGRQSQARYLQHGDTYTFTVGADGFTPGE